MIWYAGSYILREIRIESVARLVFPALSEFMFTSILFHNHNAAYIYLVINVSYNWLRSLLVDRGVFSDRGEGPSTRKLMKSGCLGGHNT